jgi:hypothetical protein
VTLDISPGARATLGRMEICLRFGAFRPELPKVGDVHYPTILIFNPDFVSTHILLVLIHFADLFRRIAMNGIHRLIVGIFRFYEPTHMYVRPAASRQRP